MPSACTLKYRAFLSYAHADEKWAIWLHRRLERYRIDEDLVGRETPVGPVPRTLGPIFRDREDFSSGDTLTPATIEALDNSAALIVLCSTVSAERRAVGEEVRLFRWRHPQRPLIPVVLEGTYPHNYPPPLRYEIAPDGTVTDRSVSVLASDVRDGRKAALAKIVAGLISVPPDDVRKRQLIADRRAAIKRTANFTSIAVLALLAGYFWWQHGQVQADQARTSRELSRHRDVIAGLERSSKEIKDQRDSIQERLESQHRRIIMLEHALQRMQTDAGDSGDPVSPRSTPPLSR